VGLERRLRGGPDHARAGQHRELDGEHAHSTARAADEDRVTGADADGAQRRIGGAAGDAQGARDVVVHAVGRVKNRVPTRAKHDRVGRSPGRCRTEDPVPHAEVLDAGADLGEDTGEVGAEARRQGNAQHLGDRRGR